MASGELDFKEKEVVKAEKVEDTKKEEKKEEKTETKKEETKVEEVPTNGLAIAGFICSLIFFVPLTGLVGLILSIVGLNQINKDGTEGKGFAIAGIAIAAVRIFAVIITLAILFFIFGTIAAIAGTLY